MKFLFILFINTFCVLSFKQKEQQNLITKSFPLIEDQFLNEFSKKPKDFLRSYFSDLKRFS